ncbi:hypothetical protein [Erwinia sp. V71]|uniref:hypothetical protein n=1 Tax=Erwinia sp. V71 TaxID=3369424 RepID=UPI003F5FEE38
MTDAAFGTLATIPDVNKYAINLPQPISKSGSLQSFTVRKVANTDMVYSLPATHSSRQHENPINCRWQKMQTGNDTKPLTSTPEHRQISESEKITCSHPYGFGLAGNADETPGTVNLLKYHVFIQEILTLYLNELERSDNSRMAPCISDCKNIIKLDKKIAQNIWNDAREACKDQIRKVRLIRWEPFFRPVIVW